MGCCEYFRNCWSSGVFTHIQQSLFFISHTEWCAETQKTRSKRQRCGYPKKCLVSKAARRKMARKEGSSHSITATALYTRGEQKSISARANTSNFKKHVDWNGRRPRRVSLLSAEHGNLMPSWDMLAETGQLKKRCERKSSSSIRRSSLSDCARP